MTDISDTGVVCAITTCPNPEDAARLAEILVTEQLAACVNQVPGVQSTYVWKGELQRDAEILLLIKTTAEQLETVASRIKALHPYELPEFIVLPVCAGSQPYLNWLRQNVRPKSE